ncbi:hypothetical protein ECANGB1_1704 [Enterospora canceri]|uniref:Uncharacterized protein n=1 Tax=Enterospora canceri TaxID=1081671 RepID=A0A1Y1S959_9MICR|nr:hypothetical protein ECANGB1_1704 [Enterospora canceri]
MKNDQGVGERVTVDELDEKSDLLVDIYSEYCKSGRQSSCSLIDQDPNKNDTVEISQNERVRVEYDRLNLVDKVSFDKMLLNYYKLISIRKKTDLSIDTRRIIGELDSYGNKASKLVSELLNEITGDLLVKSDTTLSDTLQSFIDQCNNHINNIILISGLMHIKNDLFQMDQNGKQECLLGSGIDYFTSSQKKESCLNRLRVLVSQVENGAPNSSRISHQIRSSLESIMETLHGN